MTSKKEAAQADLANNLARVAQMRSAIDWTEGDVARLAERSIEVAMVKIPQLYVWRFVAAGLDAREAEKHLGKHQERGAGLTLTNIDWFRKPRESAQRTPKAAWGEDMKLKRFSREVETLLSDAEKAISDRNRGRESLRQGLLKVRASLEPGSLLFEYLEFQITTEQSNALRRFVQKNGPVLFNQGSFLASDYEALSGGLNQKAASSGSEADKFVADAFRAAVDANRSHRSFLVGVKSVEIDPSMSTYEALKKIGDATAAKAEGHLRSLECLSGSDLREGLTPVVSRDAVVKLGFGKIAPPTVARSAAELAC